MNWEKNKDPFENLKLEELEVGTFNNKIDLKNEIIDYKNENWEDESNSLLEYEDEIYNYEEDNYSLLFESINDEFKMNHFIDDNIYNKDQSLFIIKSDKILLDTTKSNKGKTKFKRYEIHQVFYLETFEEIMDFFIDVLFMNTTIANINELVFMIKFNLNIDLDKIDFYKNLIEDYLFENKMENTLYPIYFKNFCVNRKYELCLIEEYYSNYEELPSYIKKIRKYMAGDL